MHRNLSPENVLLTENRRVKICGFGSAKFLGCRINNYGVGTKFYKAPELLLGAFTYQEKIDVWAAGCILVELFSLNYFLKNTHERYHLWEMICVLGKPPKSYFAQFNLPEKFVNSVISLQSAPLNFKTFLDPKKIYKDSDSQNADLVKKIFSWNPVERPSAVEVLKHPFFTS